MARKQKKPAFELNLEGNVARNIESANKKIVEKAFEKIGQRTIQYAIGSVRRQTANAKHSLPGNPVKTKRGQYKQISNYTMKYRPRLMRIDVGVKKFGPRKNKKDGSVIQNVPRLLEFGGGWLARKPTVIHRSQADQKYIRWYAAKVNKKRRRAGKPRKPMGSHEWVVFPPGMRRMIARPTLRLAYNKALRASNLKKAFAGTGLYTMKDRTSRRYKGLPRKRRR